MEPKVLTAWYPGISAASPRHVPLQPEHLETLPRLLQPGVAAGPAVLYLVVLGAKDSLKLTQDRVPPHTKWSVQRCMRYFNDAAMFYIPVGSSWIYLKNNVSMFQYRLFFWYSVWPRPTAEDAAEILNAFHGLWSLTGQQPTRYLHFVPQQELQELDRMIQGSYSAVGIPWYQGRSWLLQTSHSAFGPSCMSWPSTKHWAEEPCWGLVSWSPDVDRFIGWEWFCCGWKGVNK